MYGRGKNRRDALRDLGLCINGASHGRATHGSLCLRCRLIHAYGAFKVERAESAGTFERLRVPSGIPFGRG